MFWDYQGVLLAHFQKHGENMNSASYKYYAVLLKLWDAIHRKHPGQLARGVLLHHDNTKIPHTARATKERIQDLQRELLEHPPYSPNLVTSDFHLFVPLKTTLDADVSLMTKRLRWAQKWLRQQSKDFYDAGFEALVN
jgi:histone-lysine N-methyltransferase SETMAR